MNICFFNIITKDMLYDTAVGLNNCKDWYNDIIDPRKTNQVFDLAIAAVAGMSENIMRPLKEENDLDLFYPQEGEGTCGV